MSSSVGHQRYEDEDLDFEPAEAAQLSRSMDSEMSEQPPSLSSEVVTRLRCSQCEFLKFKNIDQWKNHMVGHWRLSGMKTEFELVCFVTECYFTNHEDNFEERLSKMGEHFIQQHSFKQDAYRKCDICNLEFMEERKYNSHMRKHDESFKCELCNKKITGRSWYERHKQTCVGDERPKWARKPAEAGPGEDKEVLEIYGKEYDVYWGHCTNTFTKVTRIAARAWIEGKAWAGKGATKEEARSKLIKYLREHIKKTLDKGLYTLEDGELVPEPSLSSDRNYLLPERNVPKEKKQAPSGPTKLACEQCGTQFSKKSNLELHMFMHRSGDTKHFKNKAK